MRALEVEALAFLNLTSANAQSSDFSWDALAASAPQSTSRTRAAVRWIAIASLLAFAGLETFLSFTLQPNGLL
jgi:hypothetical protein